MRHWRLTRAGWPVVVCELAEPLTIRRTVAVSTAVTEGDIDIAGDRVVERSLLSERKGAGDDPVRSSRQTKPEDLGGANATTAVIIESNEIGAGVRWIPRALVDMQIAVVILDAGDVADAIQFDGVFYRLESPEPPE